MSEFHIKIVKLDNIIKHPNADSLSIARVHNGYPCVIRTGSFKEGDLASYIPIDSTLPNSEYFSFLRESDRKRLRAKKIRGIFSMGLLIEAPDGFVEGDNVQEFFNITKWEPQIDMKVGGESEKGPENWQYIQYTDIEGLRRHPDILIKNEEVVITEKIHGCNARYVHDGKRLWVGSRTQIKKDTENNLWWNVARKLNLSEILAQDPMKIVFGEIYGWVQDLKYGVERSGCGAKFRAFDVFDTKKGCYLDYDEALQWTRKVNIQYVPPLYKGPWDLNLIETLCEGKTMLGAHNVREGFVVKPLHERYDDRVGRVILKMIGQGYLLRKQK